MGGGHGAGPFRRTGSGRSATASFRVQPQSPPHRAAERGKRVGVCPGRWYGEVAGPDEAAPADGALDEERIAHRFTAVPAVGRGQERSGAGCGAGCDAGCDAGAGASALRNRPGSRATSLVMIACSAVALLMRLGVSREV